MASSPLVRGLLAGAQLGAQYNASQRQQKLDARDDEKYAREEASRSAYEGLQKDYYQNTGAFAPKDAATPETQAQAGASFDVAESRRLGVQPPEAAQALQAAPAGLSLTPQQTASLKPVPMDQDQKDQLYYSKLGEWAATHLPPEKRVGYMKDVEQLKEMGYNRQRTDAFRLATSGKKEGLDLIGKMYNGLVPDNYDMDTTGAQFDPTQGWVGVKLRNKTSGETKDLPLDDKTLSTMFMRSDPAQLLAARLSLAQEGREVQKMGLAVKADTRADTAEARALTTQQENVRLRERELEIRDAEVKAAAADRKEARRATWANINLGEARLKLETEKAAGDERAKDVLTRMTIFERTFSSGAKPTELSSPEEKQRYADAQQHAGMATMLYQSSSEGVKPDQRNGIQSEATRFVNGFLDAKLKPGDFLKQEDGSYSYGRLKGIPAEIAEQVLASEKKPGEKPGKGDKKPAEKPGVATEPPSKMGLTAPPSARGQANAITEEPARRGQPAVFIYQGQKYPTREAAVAARGY